MVSRVLPGAESQRTGAGAFLLQAAQGVALFLRLQDPAASAHGGGAGGADGRRVRYKVLTAVGGASRRSQGRLGA